MFLIKRPFSQRQAIRGRYTYGKTIEKEEFCKEIGRAEAPSGAQGSHQEVPRSPGYNAAGGVEKNRATVAEIQTAEHRVACDSAGPESSREEAGPVHPPTETKAPRTSGCYG